jgi:DNA-binding NarL/FixJ family response regulator/tetratricopeptide (TPR) repeat protein
MRHDRAYDPSMVRVASPTFVGRAAELAALDDALDAAAQGKTTTILIGGDPGVGKTRLLQTWNDRALQRGARIASGSCLDLGETGPAFTAVVEALRELLGGLGATDEATLVGPDRSVLARIVPELGGSPDPDATGVDRSSFAQTRLFDRLADVFQRAAATGPLIVELEDIHWADRSSQAFLLYLVEVSRAANLLLVGTYRPEVAETDQAFRTTLDQLLRRSRVSTLPIAPFDRDELREQLTGILGSPPSTSLLAAIQARSEGNALFAEELAAARDPSVDLPASVGAATASKVAGLSTNARALLRVASVVGRTSSYSVLQEVTSLGDADLGDALRETVRARLLEPIHVGEAYRFRHALLEEAIYEETLPGERRRLHGAVARALADGPDRPPDADLAPRLATHWYEAHEFNRAFASSGAAAAAAERQSAYAEAATHYERLLELWDSAGDSQGALTRAGVRERAAWNALLAGDLERSATHLREALLELETAPEPSLQVRVLDLLHWTLSLIGQDPWEALRPLAELDPGGRPEVERLTIQISRARALEMERQYVAAVEIARPLVEQAAALNDARLFAQAAIVYTSLLQKFDVDLAVRTVESAREVAARAGDDVVVADVDLSIALVLTEAQRYEQLLAAAQRGLDHADRSGLGRRARPSLRYCQALAYLRLGRLAECHEQIELARVDLPRGLFLSLLELVAALVATATGAFEAAAARLEASRLAEDRSEVAELDRGWLATGRAELALAEHRLEDVQRIVDTTAPRILGAGAFTAMTETIWWLAEVGLGAAAERAERARAASDQAVLEESRSRMGTLVGYVEEARRQRDLAGLPDLGMTRGHEALIAGHVARIEGRDEPGLWATAADRFPPSSLEALTAQYRQAEAMLANRASRDDVTAVMVPAHAAALEIGARPLAGRFEALARRARIDLRHADEVEAPGEQVSPPEEARKPGTEALRNRGLTDREIEVLTLVASGYSNAEIAERLFISSKTASVHVSHILDKLGVSTRTEAATIGVRLGLPEVDEHG